MLSLDPAGLCGWVGGMSYEAGALARGEDLCMPRLKLPVLRDQRLLDHVVSLRLGEALVDEAHVVGDEAAGELLGELRPVPARNARRELVSQRQAFAQTAGARGGVGSSGGRTGGGI